MGTDIFPRDKETGELNWPISQVSGYLCTSKQTYNHPDITNTHTQTVGLSAVIFIPLIFLALYVNKLIARAKATYKQMLKALRDPDTLLDPVPLEDSDDHDSDDERTFVDRRTNLAKSDRYGLDGTNNSSSDENGPAGSSDDENLTFAPLFGRYHFHRHIPLLRNLWRYRKYRRPNARRKDNRWKDTYITDYPLRYYHAKVNMRVLITFVVILAYLGSAKHQRARARNKRMRKARAKNHEDETSSDSSASGVSSSSSNNGGRVVNEKGKKGGKVGKSGGKKGKKSVSSGYWNYGAGNRSTGWEAGDPRDGWSNQTRSRGSLRFEDREGDEEAVRIPSGVGEEGKKKRLAWLRMRRRKGKGSVDEESGGGGLEGKSLREGEFEFDRKGSMP